jgi:hypothetical protein
MGIRISINEAQLRDLLTGPGGPVVRTVTRHTRRILNEAQAAAPVDTGAGRAGMRSEIVIRGGRVIGYIYMPRHMWYQHQGTGIHGPTGQPIRPKNAKVLVWKPRGSKKLVYAMKSAGVPPNPFLADAARRIWPWPVQVRR